MNRAFVNPFFHKALFHQKIVYQILDLSSSSHLDTDCPFVSESMKTSVLGSKYICVITIYFSCWIFSSLVLETKDFLTSHVCMSLFFNLTIMYVLFGISMFFLFHAFLRRVEELRGTAVPVHHLAKNHPRLDF